MSLGRRAVLGLLVAAFVGCTACGAPPEKEMQEAQAALDAARAAGAEQYAYPDYVAAADALKRAQDAVADRDYRLALNNALQSRELADAAAKRAATEKVSARSDADHAISALSTALSAAQVRLKNETGRVAPRTLAMFRRSVSDAERRVQEARTAFDRADYPTARKTATAGIGELSKATRTLDEAAGASSRRRR